MRLIMGSLFLAASLTAWGVAPGTVINVAGKDTPPELNNPDIPQDNPEAVRRFVNFFNTLMITNEDGVPALGADIMPESLFIDSKGKLYFQDKGAIRTVDAKGNLRTLVAKYHNLGDGFFRTRFSSKSNIFQEEFGKIPSGVPTDRIFKDGIPAAFLNIEDYAPLTVDRKGDLYLAVRDNDVPFSQRRSSIDKFGISNMVIVKISDGKAHHIAGLAYDKVDKSVIAAMELENKPIPAKQAYIQGIDCLAFDRSGNLYFSEGICIRKLDTQGYVTTFAGSLRESGYRGEKEPLQNALFKYIKSMAFDGSGNLYVLDESRIRKISKDGKISTYAGNANQGCEGDEGLATNATLSGEYIVADERGNVFIASKDCGTIRKISPKGVINVVAGNPKAKFGEERVTPGNMKLFEITGMALDKKGNLYLSEMAQIRKITGVGHPADVKSDGLGNIKKGVKPQKNKGRVPSPVRKKR